MKLNEFALAGLLAGTVACAEKQEPGSSYPVTSYESSSDGEGGSEGTTSITDKDLLHDYAWDNYRNALAQAVSGDFEENSWKLLAADDEDLLIDQDASVDLMIDVPFEVTQMLECEDDRQVSVVFGMVEDCDFSDLGVVQSPIMVAAPYDVSELGGGSYTYYSVDFDEGRLEFDGEDSQVGVMAVPFAWTRDGDDVRNVHAVPSLGVTCFELDSRDNVEVHYFFPVE